MKILFVVNVVLKITAAFITPFTFILLFGLYNTMINLISGNSLFYTMDWGWSFVFYIYALPAYLIIGVPISLILDRMNKGIQWLNHLIVGIFVGLISLFNSNLQEIIDSVIYFGFAALAYYVTFVLLKKLVYKLKELVTEAW